MEGDGGGEGKEKGRRWSKKRREDVQYKQYTQYLLQTLKAHILWALSSSHRQHSWLDGIHVASSTWVHRSPLLRTACTQRRAWGRG